jgi:hypothetical protein
VGSMARNAPARQLGETTRLARQASQNSSSEHSRSKGPLWAEPAEVAGSPLFERPADGPAPISLARGAPHAGGRVGVELSLDAGCGQCTEAEPTGDVGIPTELGRRADLGVGGGEEPLEAVHRRSIVADGGWQQDRDQGFELGFEDLREGS